MYKIRQLKIRDLPAFAKMLGTQWNLGRYTTGAGNICNWIYLAEILKVNTEMIVLVSDDDRPVGFAGYSYYYTRKNWWRRMIGRMMFKLLFLFVKNKNALRQYYSAYDYAPEHIKKNFDSECDMLITDKDVRGKKLGKQLFEQLCVRAANVGATRMRIDTDDHCGVGFYRRMGCRQVFVDKIANGGEVCVEFTPDEGEDYSENVYIFEKTLTPPVQIKNRPGFNL